MQALPLASVLDERSDGAHQIELGEDFKFAGLHFDENGGAGMAEHVSNAFDWRVTRNDGERGTHHFADNQLAKVFAL